MQLPSRSDSLAMPQQTGPDNYKGFSADLPSEGFPTMPTPLRLEVVSKMRTVKGLGIAICELNTPTAH